MADLLTGKVVLVTGGARGIGAAICRVLAREGAVVMVNYSASEANAHALVGEIQDTHGAAFACRADVRNATEVENMVTRIVDRHGKLDGLVNNAIAGAQNATLDECTWDTYQNMLDFGAKAVVNTIAAARPVMRAEGGGAIVNIVTELWDMAPDGWSPYLAGKGAMVGISRSLAAELGPERITVNMVAPGWMADEKVDTSSESSRAFAASLPLRRHGSAEEIGNACAFFLSDLATYITGAYLPVTGGRVR